MLNCRKFPYVGRVFLLLFFSVQKAEIEKLLSMYNKYVEGSANKKLDRLKFRDILHDMFGMTDDMLMDRGMIIKCTCLHIND